MKKLIKEYIKAIGIGLIITYGWQGLELLMIGKTNPNMVDSIIGLILTLSLYINLKMWKRIKS